MTTKTDIEQQRAAFEAWMRRKHPNHSLEYVNEHYTYSPPQRLWEAYQAGRAALQEQDREDASEWMKQHEALMRRVSKAAIVVGYGGTINGATAEQTLENAEKGLLDHVRRRIEGEAK